MVVREVVRGLFEVLRRPLRREDGGGEVNAAEIVREGATERPGEVVVAGVVKLLLFLLLLSFPLNGESHCLTGKLVKKSVPKLT